MAQFSDTTNKNGLIQLCEFWTRQPDGAISGNATLLKQFTGRINSAFEKLMPLLLAYNDEIRWDDLNNTDAPIGYVNIVQNQNDYKITTDANSYDILNITHVRILTSATATLYIELQRITADDEFVTYFIDPATGRTGVPFGFVELGNTLYLDCLPSYSATNGIQLFFGRQQQYFVSSDTTKVPGIPKPFHELLALYAAHDWNMVNRSKEINLLNSVQARINKQEQDLKQFINLRHPTRGRMSNMPIKHV